MDDPDEQALRQLLTVVEERVTGVRTHLDSLMARAQTADPLLRARLLNDLQAALEDIARQVQAGRLAAIGQLRDLGYSYEQLARVLGISKSRARQLVAATRR